MVVLTQRYFEELQIKLQFKVRKMYADMHPNINININYDQESCMLNINIRHEYTELYSKQLNISEITDIENYLNQLIEGVFSYCEEHKKLALDYHQMLGSLVPKPEVFKFQDHSWGSCRYQSIGYSQYCYMGLMGSGTHRHWIRLYFNREGITFERTMTELTKCRATRQAEAYYRTDTPPTVWYIHPKFESHMKDYIKANEARLYSEAMKLPLNKLEVREDINYDVSIMLFGIEDDRKLEILTPCLKGELQNPDAPLWLVMKNDTWRKTVLGFARPIDGSKKPREFRTYNPIYNHQYGYTSRTPQDQWDEGAVIYGNNSYYHHSYNYTLGDEIDTNDQFLEALFDKALKEYHRKQEEKEKASA